MKKRVYDNEKLQEILNRYVKEERYGDFKPLLDEIFLRRAYEYRFDEKKMRKQIKNFVIRTERIVFGKNIPDLGERSLACYNLTDQRGSIYFNCGSPELKWKGYLEMYEILTHEVYHAISKGRVYSGLANDSTKKNIVEDEIIVETAAYRTVYERTKEADENFRQETTGFPEITFITNLLATAFNIEEREFLKGGLQNRKEFKKSCSKYLSLAVYRKDILPHYNILKENLDKLYEAMQEKKDLMDSEKISESLREICSQIYEMANINIAKSTRKIDSEYAEELAYSFVKMRQIMNKSLEGFAEYGYLSKTAVDILASQATNKSFEYLNQVSDIIALTDQKSQITDKSVWQEMEALAKQGQLIKNAEKFGIEAKDIFISRFILIKNHKKTNHEFENPTHWDNEFVIEKMKSIWEKREVLDIAQEKEEMKSKRILQKIKHFLTQFHNRKQKRIEANTENYRDLKNNFDEKYQVSLDDLKTFRNSTDLKKPFSNQERD